MEENNIIIDGIYNHKLKTQLVECDGYYFGRNFIISKIIAERKPFIYKEGNLESLEINNIKNSFDILLKFNRNDTTITRLKHLNVSLNEKKEKIPMWRTEQDSLDVYHYFNSKSVGWFLCRLVDIEKDNIYYKLRRVANISILYVFYKKEIIFCIAETVVDSTIVCENCGRKLYINTTKVIEQYGWNRIQIKDEKFLYFCCESCRDRFIDTLEGSIYRYIGRFKGAN